MEMGVITSTPMPPKPQELIEYELIKETGVLWVSGGWYDQPWIFVEKYLVVKNEVEIRERIRKTNNHNG